MVLEIRYRNDPILRKVALPIRKITQEIVRLSEDMLETMYAEKGVGLAAPQVGVPFRLVVLDVGEGPLFLINPVLVSASGETVDREGCLSVPGTFGMVKRAGKVVARGLDRSGAEIEITGEGFLARVIQHEIDHLDGLLFVDKATQIEEE